MMKTTPDERPSVTNTSRRNFLTATGVAALSAAALSQIPFAANAAVPEKQSFVRHVLYWMKDPSKPEDVERLVQGLKELCTVEQIRQWQVGKPLEHDDNVAEKSYAVSLLMIFDSREDYEKYHKDPIHAKFVKECSPLWSKTTGYSTLSAR
jgi:hypothetical protein